MEIPFCAHYDDTLYYFFICSCKQYRLKKHKYVGLSIEDVNVRNEVYNHLRLTLMFKSLTFIYYKRFVRILSYKSSMITKTLFFRRF